MTEQNMPHTSLSQETGYGAETAEDHESAQPSDASRRSRFLSKGMRLPFILLVCCFAAWGAAANLTDPLVSVFGSVFSMSTFQASVVQFAYYGAYFVLAIPGAYITSKFGYKTGVLVGLCFAAVGGFLFFPAAGIMTYGVFILALFTLAAGLSVLETAANPFVMAMGPEKSATRRINLAQAFNPVGVNVGGFLAAVLILPNVNPADAATRAAMTEEQLRQTQSAELQSVMGPYIGLAVLYIVLAVAIGFIRIPRSETPATQLDFPSNHISGSRLIRLASNRLYSFGVLAQFCNVAAQTCIWTFLLHYTKTNLGATDTETGHWLQAALFAFLIFRFVMTALMLWFRPVVLMLVMCSIGLGFSLVTVFTGNILGALALVGMSACISLLFPTIYGISLHGLGEDTKYGAAGLVMAIVGGALVPLLQGWLIDVVGVSTSYLVVTICFAVMVAFGIFSRRRVASREEGGRAAITAA